MTDFDAMRGSDHLVALNATRDAIVSDLKMCESMRDKAALYTRLESTLKLIKEATPAEPKGDGIDEIAKRRAARRTSPAKSAGRAKRASE